MGNLFFGYDLRDYTKKEVLNIDAILARHAVKYGKPPSILINKNDSESIPTSLGAEVDKYVLPHSILLEILEPLEASND
jgi:hypothetical protein